MTTFTIVEQHDGRYILVAIYGKQSFSTRKGETLIPYEEDVRSIARCYEAVADYVVDSGMYLDGPITINHIRHPA